MIYQFPAKLCINSGDILKMFDVFGFVQVLALLISSGVPIKQALGYAGSVMSNAFLRKRVGMIAKLIDKGESLETAIKKEGLPYFPKQLIAVVSVGEKSGKIGEMLQQAAIFFSGNLHSRVQTVTTLFQPILLLAVGLLIGFIMFAIYMPIFNMAYISY